MSGEPANPDANPAPHRRRPRYSGKNPRRFEDKYKEHAAGAHPDTIAKVMAAGKTPAGTHRPIMVEEILQVLAPRPGDVTVDCTLGYGGHAREILKCILPGGRLLGLDQDPMELPKTEKRMRDWGCDAETFMVIRSNFAGIGKAMTSAGLAGADLILADLGVSSMQIDDPRRGFSIKLDGPVDMRMNPERGQPASAWLERVSVEEFATALTENSDEPFAAQLAPALAGRHFDSTLALASAIRNAHPRSSAEERDLSVRRVFQALRIAVNEEFTALDQLLRQLPHCLKPGGRAAILTFHSGEDRRVKKAFQAGLASEIYAEISPEVIRPSAAERHANPRSTPAKLRWVRRSL